MQLLARLQDRPFAVIGVNSDRGDGAAARIRREGPPWRHAVEGGPQGPISMQWNVRAWPTMVVLDAEGRIRARGHSVRDLAPVLDDLLPTK